jgi:G3E family GTPase
MLQSTSVTRLYGRWITLADRLMITKSDIANPPPLRTLIAELAWINPAADILDIQGVDTFGPLLGTSDFPERRALPLLKIWARILMFSCTARTTRKTSQCSRPTSTS